MKQIKFFWNPNPEASVVAYRLDISGIANAQIDVTQNDYYISLPEGSNIDAFLFAVANGPDGLKESSPAHLSFVVPTSDYTPSTPTGFGWEVVS